jgi:hypothetical protein
MTQALDSIHERLLQGMRQAYSGVILTLPDDRIYVRTLPDEKAITYPCVFITVGTTAEQEGESDFLNDCVIYPVGVFIGDRAPIDDQKARPLFLGWRKALMQRTRALTTLPGVPECMDVRVNPETIIQDLTPRWFSIQSGFTAQCHTWTPREPRQE